MKLLFELTHPAHVHLFRNAIGELRDDHDVTVTSREKDVTVDLLEAYGIPHTVLSSTSPGMAGTIEEWIRREIRLARIARQFEPDVIISRFNPAAAHASRLVGCPYLMMEDTENKSALVQSITYPFADRILTPSSFRHDIGPRQRRYDGYHELAYLHPDRFSPNATALEHHGIDPNECYYVLRTIAWDAFHDIGKTGVTRQGLSTIVSMLENRGSVYITSESPLPSPFEPYRLSLPPHLLHDLLAYANGYIGDSGTMATEAAILGTPAIRADPFATASDNGNFVELEQRYGLLYSTPNEDDAIDHLRRQLDDPTLSNRQETRRKRLLSDKIDVTALIISQIEQFGRPVPREVVA